ncbi:MAG TPA: DNA polymerase III subunit beta [Patescibacteria group bacterium]|jgi:DNA polymerase-3 subunit beta|nr:DNA polymerase III subunit beta [Patescibacteria group bacterium]
MKVICTQENLRNGLQQVSRIVGSSQTLPILNNVLLQTENGQLKISATNLEMGMSTSVRCKLEKEGSVCIAAKVLLDLVNNLPNENITIEVGDAETSVTTERYQTKIKHLPAEDFPLIPAVEDGSLVAIAAADLKEVLDSVVFSASTSETQPEISGISLRFENSKMVATATDRYRLGEMSIPVQTTDDRAVVVPHRSIAELSRMLAGVEGSVGLNISATQMALTVNDTYMVTRLIDGQYPEYAQIIPNEPGSIITLEHSALLSALKTSGIFSRGAGSVTLGFDSEKQIIQLMSASQGVGESVVDIPCQITGEAGSVILNFRYMLDLLTNTSPEVIDVHIIDDTKPVVFRPQGKDNYLYLIMPIRL